MKLLSNTDLLKLSALLFVSFAFFYIGKHWSDGYQQLVFFSTSRSSQNAAVFLSPNYNKTFNISSLISSNQTQSQITSSPHPSPPPTDLIRKFGIVNENGMMSDEFEIGEYNPDLVETEWGNGNGTEAKEEKPEIGGDRVNIRRFEMCPQSMREYIPCLDNVEAIKRLKSTEKGEKFERHCPENGTVLNCLVPPPKGYKSPIPWPRSRDEVL